MLTPEEPVARLQIGDRVVKGGGDYTFDGVVVAKFFKRDGFTLRVVVENDDGMLFIFNSGQLEKV